jgi:ArsR family transcriptional regulator
MHPPETALALLKVLADPMRLRVIEALGGGERCVCDLTADLQVGQSRLSFHLKVMRQAGLVQQRQEGRWMYYRLDPEALSALSQWLASLEQRCGRSASPCA